jgi:hypothetical protein
MVRQHPDHGGNAEVFKILSAERSRTKTAKQKFRVIKKKIGASSFTSPKALLGSAKGIGKSPVEEDIHEPLDEILRLLKEEHKLEQDAAEVARKKAEDEARAKKEKNLERWTALKKTTSAVVKPFRSLWDKIWGFISKVFLGRVLFKIIEWMGDKKNQGKLENIFRFLKDWWPALLTTYLAFGNGLGRFVTKIVGKLVIWSGKLLMTVIPALWKAIAAMGPWGWAALGVGAVGTGIYMHNKNKNKEEETQNFATGGFVSGPSGVDQVPARLTAGEFVMSKGAVQKYGANTLASMNAMGGGTNRPTFSKYNEGGGVVTDPKEKAQQEAYMLKFVNEERLLQGLEPLNNLTYAPGVELTKMIGPGPRTKETSHTDYDFDTGMKTTSSSKTVDGKLTNFGGTMSRITPEEREKFFAANPHAAQLVNLKDQMELDNLGADISASARMNGGGLVPGYAGGGGVELIGPAEGFGKGKAGSRKFSGAQLRNMMSVAPTRVNIATIAPPIKKNNVVQNYQIQKQQVKKQNLSGNSNKVPNFNAEKYISEQKLKTLGLE